MSMVEDLEDREDQPHVGWTPRVLRGGKGPPEAPVSNWLRNLELNTVFVCSAKNTPEGNLFKVIWRGTKYFLLHIEINDVTFDRYVHTLEFSKNYPEYEVLGVDTPEAPVRGESNERNPRRLPDLVLHEAVQGVDQLPLDPE